MLPLRDDLRPRTVPVVTLTLVALNVIAFVIELAAGARLDRLLSRAAVVPFLYTGADRALSSAEVIATTLQPDLGLRLVYSLFLHGGWMHIMGNLLYLWIFGDDVEDRLGHARYLVFYLACGWVATYAQIWSTPASHLPAIGASGAIAGVLGAYLALHPGSRVLTLLPLALFTSLVRIPAYFFLGFWFAQQFLAGILSLSNQAAQTVHTGGVAWWAHIGGFVAGVTLAHALKRRRSATRAAKRPRR